ncbi:MAG: DUF983 domain-containing protein [Herpetosiphonaceae bacterium]|nr:DUF983 domain-containing protein [Herpetosiphonaceae bacterium]
MRQLLLALLRGFTGRCPLCGRGRLFRSYYKVRDRCESCNVQFEPTSGQSTGAMAINLVLTIIIGFVGGIFLVLYAPDRLGAGLLALLAVMTIFHIIFYRFARGLWLGIMVATGDLAHDRDELG